MLCGDRRNRSKEKRDQPKAGPFFTNLHSAGDLTGTEASGADVHVSGSTLHDRLHALHVGLPGTVGTAMRVRDLDAERNALIAELALSHPLHLLAVAYFHAICRHNWYHNRKVLKMQVKYVKKEKQPEPCILITFLLFAVMYINP